MIDEPDQVQPGESVDSNEARGELPQATPGDAPGSPSDAATEATPGGTPDEAPATDGGASAPAAHGSAGAKPRPRLRDPSLMRAYRTGRAVQGTIRKVIKGGYEVRVGRSRGFCPHSQVAIERVAEPEGMVGKTCLFRVTQLRRGGEDVVVSRRSVLEEERADEAKAVRATLIEGAVMRGRVAGTADFGAFVDLGAGVMGLAHISELSHERIRRVEDAVKVGDAVDVKVLELNEGKGRISLSIRQAQEDPWAVAAERFRVGQSYPGTVRRIAEFGAFVELAPGIEALAPASEFPPAPAGWKEGLEAGASRDWHVLSISVKERRISVTLPGEAKQQGPVELEATLEGAVQRIERYGLFVWLRPGKIGLVPKAWTGAPPEADLRRRFRIGDAIEVTVKEIAEDGHRIRLARKGVKIEPEEAPRPEKAKARQAEPPRPEEESSSFGTSLADKLRAALGRTESE